MPFRARPLGIPGVIEVTPDRFADQRGSFAETYRAAAFASFGVAAVFVQDNESVSVAAGTIRGLHFQRPPKAQAKLVRVLRGAIFDVAVDLRTASPDYGRWTGTRLTAEGGEQLFVPAGFAHGFCTLAPDTVVAYKCDAYYDSALDSGLHFADPDLAIAWPVDADEAILSDRDRRLPAFRDLVSPFTTEAA